MPDKPNKDKDKTPADRIREQGLTPDPRLEEPIDFKDYKHGRRK